MFNTYIFDVFWHDPKGTYALIDQVISILTPRLIYLFSKSVICGFPYVLFEKTVFKGVSTLFSHLFIVWQIGQNKLKIYFTHIS